MAAFSLANGEPVSIPTMKSLYIEMYYDEMLLASGTAFLAARDQKSHCALITNRHNVTGRHQETNACLSKTAAIPNNVVVYFHAPGAHVGQWKPIKLSLYGPDRSPYWIEHPTLGALADAVALNVRWGEDVRLVPYYVDRTTSLDRDGALVDPAEPVSVIGFPFGLSAFGKFPIWATGFLAQDLSLIPPDHPVFLIDCRTRQGQSGSPVIAYRTHGTRRRDGEMFSVSISPVPKWEFLGIYAGRVNRESDLGIVWHASAVEELLTAAEADLKIRMEAKQGKPAG